MFDCWQQHRKAKKLVLQAELAVLCAVIDHYRAAQAEAERRTFSGDYDYRGHFQQVCRERRLDPDGIDAVRVVLERLERRGRRLVRV